MKVARLIILASLAALAGSCGRDKTETSLAASARATASIAPPASVAKPAPAPQQGWPVPTGPRLAILPGAGVGPIRIGATVQTIERHMQAPCEYRTENSCRYVGHALEFFLKDGVANEIRVHRLDRKTTPEPRTFGVFNGRFVEGVAFGMFPFAAIELLGQPKKVEKVTQGGPWNTVEVHHYDGMRLEYDRIENGNVVLGGVVIFKSTAPSKAGQSARRAPTANETGTPPRPKPAPSAHRP